MNNPNDHAALIFHDREERRTRKWGAIAALVIIVVAVLLGA